MKNVDYKGKQLFNGEEYFIFENENGFEVVHCEDLQEYLGPDFLYYDSYENAVKYIEKEYGIYPEVYLQNGEFK